MGYEIDSGPSDTKINTRVMTVKVDAIKFSTPSKTIDEFSYEGKINEYSPSFTDNYLDQYRKKDYGRDLKGRRKHSNPISRMWERPKPGMINVMLPNYKSAHISSNQVETMTLLHAPYADIIVTPRWEGMLKAGGSKSIELIKNTTKDYLDQIGNTNNLVFGNIPMIASMEEIEDLMGFYYKHEITSFALDYCNHAAHTTASNTLFVKKKLRSDGHLNESLLYSYNVRRVSPSGHAYTPADDFLVFGQGIDIIGNLHMGGGSSDSDGFREPPQPKAPVFQPDSYTYIYRQIVENERKSIKVDNCRMQETEAALIRKAILYTGTSYDMLNQKEGARPISKMMDTPASKTSKLTDFY